MKPKDFYKYAAMKEKYTNEISLIENSTAIVEPKDCANKLKEQFSSSFNHAICDDNIRVECDRIEEAMPEVEISEEIVLKKLQNLNPNKSTGPDKISPQILKRLASSLARPLTKIFKESLAHSVVPEALKKSRITPVLKKRRTNQTGKLSPD